MSTIDQPVEQVASHVDCDVALAALDLLGGIVAAWTAGSGELYD
ncbi:hypothetical protein [Sphingomonas cynarae]